MSAGEVMHTSETGGTKAGNDDRYDLLPPRELRTLAEVHSTDYGYDWIRGSFNELNNQLWLFWDGDDVDPEAGCLRPALVAYHAMELLAVELIKRGLWDGEQQLAETQDSTSQFDGLPAEPLRLLAHHYGVGARKYADDNWQKGYDWRLTFAALNRHLWQHQSGQFLDEETGSPHLVAVVWHAITLMWFYENKPEFDTRTSTKQRQAEKLAETNAHWEAFTKAIGDWATQEEGSEYVSLKAEGRGLDAPVLYVSGPMTGMPDHNFPAFHAAAEFYRAQGYTVINPAELPGESEVHPWEWFLRRDIIAMLDGGADTIVLLPGWDESRGAQLEHYVAKQLKFSVIRHAPELDSQRDSSWVDHLNDIVVDLDDQEGVA